TKHLADDANLNDDQDGTERLTFSGTNGSDFPEPTPARVGAERGDRAGCEGSAVVEGARLGSREVQIGAIGAVSRREIELRMHERAVRAVTERRAPLGRAVFRRVGRSDPIPSSSWVDRVGDRGGR